MGYVSNFALAVVAILLIAWAAYVYIPRLLVRAAVGAVTSNPVVAGVLEAGNALNGNQFGNRNANRSRSRSRSNSRNRR